MTDVDPRIDPAIAAFNDQDPDRLMAEMTVDALFTDPLEEAISGEDLREYISDIFRAFPEIRLEVDRVIHSNDGVVAIQGEYVGTHDGPLQGIPPTGNAVSVPTMTVIDVGEDGITSWRDYWDRETFSAQLGLGFPEILPLLPRIVLRKATGSS
jgi:steroid delta-isomerase-like uncharacterized protein